VRPLAEVGVLFWTLFACGSGEGPSPAGAPPAAAPVARRPDVVVITLDTMRADRIGAYGHAAAQTDSIDQLAAAGLRFDRAYSVLPLTIPAHASLFTGLYPFHHQIRDNGASVLADSFTTMAELFRAAGYRTAGSSAAFVTTRQWGFAQGFDAFFDEMPPRVDQSALGATNYWHSERSGELVVNDALTWLAGVPSGEPVFLWVHLYDAHFPYTPPDAYAKRVPGRPYDAELAYVDDQVARVVEAFAGRAALFALVGDHGESLGEHDEGEHGIYTYDATQRVPFILSGAGVKPGVVDTPVSGVDFLPTVLTAAGLPVPDGLDGHAQPGGATVPYAESYQMVDRFRIAPHRMVVDGTLKLIQKPRPELYDLASDPGEVTNLASARPDDVRRLGDLLTALDATPPGDGAAPIDAATLIQLQALGYMPGSSGGVDPFSLPDPLEFAEFLKGVDRLSRPRGDAPEVLEKKLDALLALKPDAYELRMRKSRALTKKGQKPEARRFVEETARLFPDDARPFVQLAGMALEDGDPGAAIEYTGRALDIAPTDRLAREIAVAAQLRAGLSDDAIAAGTVWFDEDPANLGLASVLGGFWFRLGDNTRAERYLRAAVEGASPRAGARVRLAAVVAATGRRREGIELLDLELADFPSSLDAHRALSRMYADDRDYLSQVEHVRELVRLQPGSGAAVRDLAQCLFNLGDFAGARRTLDTALSLDPGDPDTVLLDANLLAKEGKKEAGAARFEEAKALDAVHRAEEGKAPRDTITRDDTEPAAAPTGAAPPASAPGANTLAAPTGATP
jgi:arylsulfatase A-like enzyme/tetratricopeptide (TPR) repeat protein